MVNAPALRIVFFGTPDFAVPTLEALVDSRHSVVGVVTRPDRPRGRGQRTSEPPVKSVALAARVPVLQPDRMVDAAFLAALAGLSADLFVVAAYGKILTSPILALPRLGAVNVHASLLPRHRGAAPIHRAVIAGDRETGITIMRMVQALDAGPMLATARRPIGHDDTSAELEHDLAEMGGSLLVSTVDRLAAGPVPEVQQDDTAATYAPRIRKEEGVIDWTRSSEAVHNLIRGLHPWPHALTHHRGRRLILLKSIVKRGSGGVFPPALGKNPPPPCFTVFLPGAIVDASGDTLDVATGDGVLAITELQAEGRRPLTAREFLAGRPMTPGDVLTMHP